MGTRRALDQLLKPKIDRVWPSLGTQIQNEIPSSLEFRSKTLSNLDCDLSSASAVEICSRCIFGSSRWSAWLRSYCRKSGASGHQQPPTPTKGSERRRSRHYVGCVATWTMGHELFLTQFEVGESISAIPSIIRGDPGSYIAISNHLKKGTYVISLF